MGSRTPGFSKSQMSESNTKNDIGYRGGGIKEGELAHGIMESSDFSDTNYRYLKIDQIRKYVLKT